MSAAGAIRTVFPWRGHAQAVRLLSTRTRAGHPTADLALVDARRPPFWFRLRVDFATMRVVGLRMIAPGNFMRQQYFAYNKPVRISRPDARPHH
jgi:hypothetical protein